MTVSARPFATVGPVESLPRDNVLRALATPQAGAVYDLDAGRWPGMPVHSVHPPFVITTYRTGRGAAVDGDMPSGPTGVLTELLSSSAHTGTHIDALSHIMWEGRWFNGGSEAEHLGDFGPTVGDAAQIAPLIRRGVLLDIARLHGVDVLAAGHSIGEDDLLGAARQQGVALQEGDVVLVRTGYMSLWGIDDERRRRHYGAGLSVEGAILLAQQGAVAVGADTDDLEQIPSADPSSFLPVHVELLVRRGIYIIELLDLEGLARDRVHEFLFVCLPLRIKGATGSMVRPIAIS